MKAEEAGINLENYNITLKEDSGIIYETVEH